MFRARTPDRGEVTVVATITTDIGGAAIRGITPGTGITRTTDHEATITGRGIRTTAVITPARIMTTATPITVREPTRTQYRPKRTPPIPPRIGSAVPLCPLIWTTTHSSP